MNSLSRKIRLSPQTPVCLSGLLALFIVATIHGQNKLSGKIVSCEDQLAIPGAKIRILEPKSEALSFADERGFFKLEVPISKVYKLRASEYHQFEFRNKDFRTENTGDIEIEPICLEAKRRTIPPGPPLSTIIYFDEERGSLEGPNRIAIEEFVNDKVQEDPDALFVIEGHQDGNESSDLANYRVGMVWSYLIANIPPSRLILRSYNNTCPAPSGNARDNRRVEVWAVTKRVSLSDIEDALECAPGASPKFVKFSSDK